MNDLKNKLSKISGYQPKKERVKKFNGNLLVWVNADDNTFTIESTSYDWWKIVINKNGLYFFNWYNYSVTTSKHQHEMSSIMRKLGLEYITVEYRDNLSTISLERILADKIGMLYSRENALSVSRATKYSVYSETEFNTILADIKAVSGALKMKESDLDKMLLAAELKATESLLVELADKHDKQVVKKMLQRENNDLSAITL